MTRFYTWDEVSNYISQLTGLTEYLDDPATWMECYKKLSSTARYIVEDGSGLSTAKYLIDDIDWLSVGNFYNTGLDSGVKSLPAVKNVITDTATGTAVIGDAALATEAVGTTITLTGAGVAAAVLVSLGIGVTAYQTSETVREFYHGLFSAIAGEELPAEYFEPITLEEVKALLTVEDVTPQQPVGNIYTYLPTKYLERAYDYIAPHITTTAVENTFPSATWDSSGNIATNPVQDIEPIRKDFISLDTMNDFMVQVVNLLQDYGYNNARPLVLDEVYETLQNNMDLTGFDYIGYSVQSQKIEDSTGDITPDWDLWDNDFLIADGIYHRRVLFEIHARNMTNDWSFGDKINLEKKHVYTNNTPSIKGYSNNDYYASQQAFSRKIDARLQIVCSKDGVISTDLNYTNVVTNNSYTGSYNLMLHDSGGGYKNPERFIGLWPYNEGVYEITSMDDVSLILFTDDPISYEEQELNEGWQDHMHIVGKAPVQGMTYKQRYSDQNAHNVKVSQPDVNGNPKQTEYTRTSVRMGTDPVDQITNHGVNNPADGRGYNQSQESAQSGKDTPRDNPISRFNDSVQDNINSYNDSKVSPETAPEEAPAGDPLPQYPNDPPTDTTGDSGDTPDPSTMTGVTASGMCSVYNPTKQELMNFSAWLWSPSFLDNFLKIFQNPMDAIIGLHIMYATPSTTTPENIVCGYLDSGVSAKVVNQQFTEIDCGTVTVPEYYGNAIDYEPYVQVHCYLPFVGIVSLKPNDIIGKKLNIKYGVDALTGTCLAILTTEKDGSEITCYNFAGNCATQIPISGGSYAQMITGLAGFVASGIGAVATANPLMALGAGASLLNSHLDVGHSGAIGANAGAMGIRKPYLIITRKKAYDASGYNQFYGFPANKTVVLGNCKGYTRVKSVHIESIPVATADEKQQIEVLLKQGVIIR